jgi:hypothetical protein
MRTVDLARCIAPHLPQRIIGIRPGEKLHEVMVPEDEARSTLDLNDRFVILPSDDPDLRAHFIARGGAPVPEGTVLVMEDRIATLGADGKAVRDARGRLVPTGQVAALAVMEKRAGWGSEYPAEWRNANWEYAAYTPEGVKRTGVNTQPCFVCHTSRRDAAREYTFTFMSWVMDGKPGPR